MDEKSNVEFHLASSSNANGHVDVNIDMTKDDIAGEDSINISGNGTKAKHKRDDDVDYVAIAKTLSSKEKKLKFSRLLMQAAPEKHILALGVLFTFFGSITNLATPVLMGSMIDAVSSGEDTAPNVEGRPTEIFCNLSAIGCDDEVKRR